uniref:Uncharacterized protein n=1 Tax=Kalanchoe fedtschenkoi TaxID=63787 RepID=A0A7N1A9P1_KALFE
MQKIQVVLNVHPTRWEKVITHSAYLASSHQGHSSLYQHSGVASKKTASRCHPSPALQVSWQDINMNLEPSSCALMIRTA